MATQVLTVRYRGSLPEFQGAIGCATLEGEWTDRDTARYTVALWDRTDESGRAPILRHARCRSLEFGTVAIFPGATCRCGYNHNRYP